MIPTVAEVALVLIAAAALFVYFCPGALQWLAARCLTRAHVIEVSKREHKTELARWSAEFGLNRDRAARVRAEAMSQ